MFFSIIATGMGIIAAVKFEYVTPLGGEIMMLSLIGFGAWFTSLRLKEKKA